MPILDLLAPNFVIHNLQVGSKKRTLDYISTIISEDTANISHDDVFSGLIERERLGSTGIGEGIAIPHCRLDNIDRAVGVFIKLESPVDFDAIDKKSVDLVFALVVPSNCCDEHLNTLAELAQLFNEKSNRVQLRACENAGELYKALSSQAT